MGTGQNPDYDFWSFGKDGDSDLRDPRAPENQDDIGNLPAPKIRSFSRSNVVRQPFPAGKGCCASRTLIFWESAGARRMLWALV